MVCFLNNFEYSVNFGKRKNFYITISNGKVLIKAPLWATQKDIQKIIEEKKSWIIKNISKTLKNSPQNTSSNKDYFFILGEKCTLKQNFVNCKKATIQKDKNIINVFLPIEKKDSDNSETIKKCFSKWYSDFSKNEIAESFKRMENLTNIHANKLTIRKMTRSWGRCSSKFNISINKDLIAYPKKAIDYVVLHELCHIVHFNHSKNFWAHVKSFMPDYKTWKEILKNVQQ